MEAPVTEYEVSKDTNKGQLFEGFKIEKPSLPAITSSDLLEMIYRTVNSPRNHRENNLHKKSITIDDTHQTVITKCNCKKSKCLKLYCECFAQGTFIIT